MNKDYTYKNGLVDMKVHSTMKVYSDTGCMRLPQASHRVNTGLTQS